MKYIWKEIAVT